MKNHLPNFLVPPASSSTQYTQAQHSSSNKNNVLHNMIFRLLIYRHKKEPQVFQLSRMIAKGQHFFKNKNYSQAIKYGEKTRKLAHKQQQKTKELRALYIQSISLMHLQRNQESLQLHQQHLSLLEERDGTLQSIQAVDIYTICGYTYYLMHRYEQALQYWSKSKEILLKLGLGKVKQTAGIYYCIAKAYQHLGMTKQLLLAYQEAYQIWKSQKQPLDVDILKHELRLAEVYYSVKMYMKFLRVFEANLKNAQKNHEYSIEEVKKKGQIWVYGISTNPNLDINVYKATLKIIDNFYDANQLRQSRQRIQRMINRQT